MKKTLHYIALAMLFSVMIPVISAAQQSVRIHFEPVAGKVPLRLEQGFYHLNNAKDSIQISTLRFYISGISFLMNDAQVWEEVHSYHLVDAAEPNKLNINLLIPEKLPYNRIHFNLGIDSSTNAGGAQGGELDATKGMYWAWQSGYINFKLEGKSAGCRTRKNEFQYHLGGFREGNDCMQEIVLPVADAPVITIAADVAEFLEKVDLVTQPMIMIPGVEAVGLSKKAVSMFYIVPAL